MAEVRDSDHFYIYLPSNSSEDIFGIQDKANFKTQLSKPVALDPTLWEVGLASLSYPRTLANLPDMSITLIQKTRPPTSKRLPSQRYNTAEHLVEVVFSTIAELLGSENQGKIRCHYSQASQTVKFEIAEDYGLTLPGNLVAALGLGENRNISVRNARRDRVCTEPNGAHIKVCSVLQGQYIVNPHRGNSHIFVYSDIVQYQYVGDSFTPLLRIVSDDLANGYAGHVTHTFNDIHYLDLQRGNFQIIEMHLTDSRGNNLSFGPGVVIGKLHFRRKRR